MRAVNDQARVRIVLLKAHIVLGQLSIIIVLLNVEWEPKVIQDGHSVIAVNLLRQPNKECVMAVVVHFYLGGEGTSR